MKSALQWAGVLAIACLLSYCAGRNSGWDAATADALRRQEITKERIQLQVNLTDQHVVEIQRPAIEAITEHRREAAARSEESAHALAADPDLAGLRLPDDLVRLRARQAADSRRAAEAAGAGR